MEKLVNNSVPTIVQEIAWYETVVQASLKAYFENKFNLEEVKGLSPPDLSQDDSVYADLIKTMELDFWERFTLILAIIPYAKPQSLELFHLKNENLGVIFQELGGIRNTNDVSFWPTLETACFVLTGTDTTSRLEFVERLGMENALFKRGVLDWDTENQMALKQKLSLTVEYWGLFSTGERQLPHFSSSFPAKEISTPLAWNDLIVSERVSERLSEIKQWLTYSQVILEDWKLSNKLKSGYRVLFYGPPGTGKTLAATLLGKETGKPVFRVDLSLIVSKYIGETEKNLSRLFNEAENKEWVLFFDEADALFGKRTQTKGANDRYANQEVAYLLQRIEDFAGVVILATNIQHNIDEAFLRRFQSIIHFALPSNSERKRLWQNLLNGEFSLAADVDIERLAEEYELAGGDMINVLRYCALEAAKRKKPEIEMRDIVVGVRREYSKRNKTL